MSIMYFNYPSLPVTLSFLLQTPANPILLPSEASLLSRIFLNFCDPVSFIGFVHRSMGDNLLAEI